MLRLAFKTKKEIIVEFIENGKLFKIVKYLPNKTFELLPIPSEMATEGLLEVIKQKLENKNYFKFLDIATKALDDNLALDKLEILITGMKISNSR